MKRFAVALLLATALPAAMPALAQQPASGPQAVAQGKALYDQHCTACHGSNGTAGERAPAIVSAAISMRGARSDAQLMAIVKNGIAGTAMPAWGNRLSDGDIADIGAFIHSLRGTALDSPLPGDPAHGEAVFWGKGGCGACHAISGRGSVVGPDLTNIAAERKSTAISDALTKAEHRVYGDGGVHLPAPPPMDNETVHVMTKSGQAIDGVMRNQDAWSLQFMGLDGKLYSFARADLRSVVIKAGGVMPTDYDKRLSADEFRDLMAFLTRQGTKIAASPSGGAE
ncbi:MAG TPA: c-type cytochrome [Rhizomicrobium sp.]|nr:c-type cytochrome [Rhizomicrobium sp.]